MPMQRRAHAFHVKFDAYRDSWESGGSRAKVRRTCPCRSGSVLAGRLESGTGVNNSSARIASVLLEFRKFTPREANLLSTTRHLTV